MRPSFARASWLVSGLFAANSDFHKAKHLYSWKTLLKCEKTWEAIARTLRANVDVALTLYRNGSWAAA